jgi:hypothetical protein
MARMWRGARWALLLVPLVQLIALLGLITQQAPRVPHEDEWAIVALAAKVEAGAARPVDFWAFHVQHRILLPRLAQIGLIEATDWNRQAEMLFNLAVAVATAALLLDALRRTVRSRNTLFVAVPIFGLLILSRGSGDYWVSPFQLTILGTIFGVALALWALARGGSFGDLCLAILGATIASLSSLAGLVAWFALLPALPLIGYRRPRYFVLWCSTALAVIGLYMRGFPWRLPYIPQTEPTTLWSRLIYALTFLGQPLGFDNASKDVPIALLSLGLLALDLMALLFRRGVNEETRRALGIWGACGLFTLGCAAQVAVGRAGTGNLAETPRYHAYSALWWIALFALGALAISRSEETVPVPPARRSAWPAAVGIANGVSLALVCVALINVDRSGAADLRPWLDEQHTYEQCLLDYALAPDSCLAVFYSPGAAVPRSLASYLERRHALIFRDAHPLDLGALMPASGPAQGAIEDVPHYDWRAGITASQGETLYIGGWAMDDTGEPVGAILLLSDGTHPILVPSRQDRPDIAAHYGDPRYRASGFYAEIPGDALAPGHHTITLRIVNHDRTHDADLPDHIEIDIVPTAASQGR